MGSSKKLELPAPPTQYTNPLQQGDMAYQSGLGHDLTSGNFGGNLSWLQSAINPNNSAASLSYAQGLLQPQFRDTLQQITNSAAANNQLNSSTFSNALAKAGSDVNSQYQSIISQQVINDSNQANQNKLSLFGSGLNTLQAGIGNEQSDSNSTNSFNLQNYENQVASAIAGQKQANGGLFGALQGAAGGALAGFSVGGPIGGLIGGIGGGLSGGLSPQAANYGGNILQSGASIYGSQQQNNTLQSLLSAGLKNGNSAPFAGAYASNGNIANTFGTQLMSGY